MAQAVMQQLRLNQLVETKSGGTDEDLTCCWCEALVIEIKDPASIVVEYLEFLEEDGGQPLCETVSHERLRPAPPAELARFTSMQEVKVGHCVEAYHDDCWWQGVVIEVATAGVNIKLSESSGSSIFVRDPRLLRPRLHFQEGEWRRAVPDPADLIAFGLSSAVSHAAVKAMMRARVVPAGPPRMRSGEASALDPPPIPSLSDKPLSHRFSTRSRRTTANARQSADVQALQMLVLEDPAARDTTVSGRHHDDVEAPRPGVPTLPPTLSPAMEGDPKGAAELGGGAGGNGGDVGGGEVVRRKRGRPRREEVAARAAAKRRLEQDEEMMKSGAGASSAAKDDITSRPRRKNKNCVVYLNGFPVLKANMYGMEAHVTQALQEALKSGKASLGPKSPQRKSPHKAAATRPKPPQPRAQTVEYTQRVEHNNAIRRDAQACEVTRARYLLTHLGRLRPFITPQVEAHIRSVADSSQRVPPSPQPITQQPEQILATLREYQLEGLAWLVAQYQRGVNAILADEMGLGKTLQTITFLAHLKYVLHVEGPHLVVVPLSVLSSWTSEFKKWCPSMRVVRLHSTDEQERHRLVKEVLSRPSSFDVAVTTYEMVNSKHFGNSLKHTLVWRYLVLDEGHKVKNEETRVSDGMRHISRQQVLMLTGTPVQNNLHELFALLNFMYPDIFTDSTRFDQAFNLHDHKVDKEQLEAAHYLLRPFVLRRLKGEVEVRLPPKVETRIHCPLVPMQTFWYRRLLLRDSSLLRDMEAREGNSAKPAADDDAGEDCGHSSWKRAMNLLIQLRKVCNHPFMFPDAEPDFDGESAPEELITGAGKMMVLDRLLAKLKQQGHRVVLFSQFNTMLDIIEDYLQARGHKYRRLDGSTNRIQRMIDIEQFNKPNSDIFIYILCTRAGGLGVNLQTADTCILYDSDWNPQWDLQAMARVHRIGQTRPVHVYRLVTEGTAEERVQRRAEAKLYLDQMVNRGSTSTAEQLEGLHLSEVLSMLKFGADRIFRNEAGKMPSDAELDCIMDRSWLVEQMEAASGGGRGGEAAGTAAASQERKSTEDPGCSGGDGGCRSPGGLGDADGVGGRALHDKDGSGAAEAAPVAAGDGCGGGVLLESKQSALDFNAEAPAVSTFLFMGQDFRALREMSLRDIASQYWADKKRQRRERLVDVDGFKVLRENNYTMEEGMARSSARKKSLKTADEGRKMQRAGVDYGHTDFCMICWDGGDLLCCDRCPAAFHAGCLGYSADDVNTLTKRVWACPHHACAKCERKTAQAGGLLFRCEMCEKAFCEDDLPADYSMVGESELFKALGQNHPRTACFIHCSSRCRELAEEVRPLVQSAIEAAEALAQATPLPAAHQETAGATPQRTAEAQPAAAAGQAARGRGRGRGGARGVSSPKRPVGRPRKDPHLKGQSLSKRAKVAR